VLEFILVYWVNCFVTTIQIGAHDTGGGMVIHLFGAYFGLAVAANMKAIPTHKDNSASYTSDITSLAGTLFLWLLWPSFNAAVAKTETDQQMAATNTFLSLCACTIATAIATRLLSGHKFDAVHMQNATLAGGVAMGVACDLPTLGLKGAILGGFVAGLLSCFGFAKVSLLLGKCGIQDTCGVHNLHGMPGLLSALIGIIAMSRSSSKEATQQLFAMFSTLAIALAGGLVTGAVMKFVSRALGTTQLQGDHFNDKSFWITASDYDSVIDDQVDEETSSEVSTGQTVKASIV
jgi:ammonium transporter Rh